MDEAMIAARMDEEFVDALIAVMRALLMEALPGQRSGTVALAQARQRLLKVLAAHEPLGDGV